MNRVFFGDCRDTMRDLKTQGVRVQCCVTSPPYYGLRDYGHPGQIGLEKTPAEYVAALVEVFEGVRELLADDGVLWLNLGSSYAGGGNGGGGSFATERPGWSVFGGNDPSQSRQQPRAPACGTDGTVLPDSTDADYACSGLCDGCLADFLNHRDRIAGTGQQSKQRAPLPSPTGRDNERSGCEPAPLAASLPSARESTTLESWRQRRGACSRCDARASSLSTLPTSLLGARESVRSSWLNYTTRFKPKDMIPIPWMVAMALQAAGWYLRQDIIWCLSGGAWVYARTQKGDMPVMVKDLVRLDPATVRLWNGEKWTRVLGWGPSNDESERVELVLRSGERIGCTGGHQWPTQRGNVVAREIRVGDTIMTCRLPEPDGSERPAFLSNDSLWLVGLYLAEGSRNGNARQLSLSADEQHWIPRIDAIARHFGGSCLHTVSNGSLSVRLYGAVLHAMIDTYIGGAAAIDKHLKVAAWRLPNEALSAVVQGYLDGDGHDDERNGRWRLGFCRNYSLERDLRTLAARLGATLTLKPGTAKYKGGDAPVFRGEWRWERSGHWNEKDRGEVVEIRASRARGFWDIAVEDEPHLFALASGVLTHNCKPNPMPESVTDRCTKAHEYLFLLTKSERYYWDAAAMQEPSGAANAHDHSGGFMAGQVPGASPQSGTRKSGNKERKPASARGVPVDTNGKSAGAVAGSVPWEGYTRNRRSVWTVPTKPYSGAHFAVFPPALIEPCILAGSRPGDVVLDPFIGSGTTAQVAQALGRQWIGCELNPEYAPLQQARTAQAALAI